LTLAEGFMRCYLLIFMFEGIGGLSLGNLVIGVGADTPARDLGPNHGTGCSAENRSRLHALVGQEKPRVHRRLGGISAPLLVGTSCVPPNLRRPHDLGDRRLDGDPSRRSAILRDLCHSRTRVRRLKEE